MFNSFPSANKAKLKKSTSSPKSLCFRPRTVLTTTAIIAIFSVFVSAGGCQVRQEPTTPKPTVLLVSAASSLTEAMRACATSFQKENPAAQVQFNFGSSGSLQKQIEQGAPVDVFVSASPKETDSLLAEHLVDPSSRSNIASNVLALIAPKNGQVSSWEDLSKPFVHRVAISNPATVPSGRYAQQTLEHKKLWVGLKSKFIFGENVRQTLGYVMSGDVDAGIVFSSDVLAAEGKVKKVSETVNGVDHKPIQYPISEVMASKNRDLALRFITFMKGPEAQGILAKYGFKPPIP